jgi:hypothetical protein
MKLNPRQPPDLVLWLGSLQPELVAICHEPKSDGREGLWRVRRYQILSARSLLQVLWQPRNTFPMPALLEPHEWRFRQWAYLNHLRHSTRMIPLT